MIKKLSFTAIIIILLLIVVEIILSLVAFSPKGYYTNTPNSGFEWKLEHEKLIGINENAKISFDELGARTISNYNKKEKIAVFGGSTTACFALSQNKTWTALLEKKLGSEYWVGNFARPGNNSNHHILQFKHILKKPELNDVKTVIIMQGVNDFLGFLGLKENYLNSKTEQLKPLAFQIYPKENIPFIKRLNIYKLAALAKNNVVNKFRRKNHLTKVAVDIKSKRQQATHIDSLPNLNEGLKKYTENTNTLIKLAKAKNIRLIFVEQATMWQPNLKPEYEKLLLSSGFLNNTQFYSTEAFNRGMKQFNTITEKLCNENNVDYIKLSLPKSTESFYDDFHFNESGANLVASKIAEYLKKIKLIVVF